MKYKIKSSVLVKELVGLLSFSKAITAAAGTGNIG